MPDRESLTVVHNPPVRKRGPSLQLTRGLPWTYWALGVFALTLSAYHVLAAVGDLPRLTEAGYGDSYVWYDVQQYAKTGVIYHCLTDPPYNPTMYSPLLYIALSAPMRMFPFSNPFLGPRLVVLSCFTGCVLIVISITRKLLRHSLPVKWSLLLLLSINIVGPWIVQLRVDFMGIFFSLLSVRLLIGQSRRCFLAAGAAAGLAFLFKATLLAAIISGVLWLLLKKRFRCMAEFASAAAIVSLTGYSGFLIIEPHMLEHLRLMSAPIPDLRGGLDIAGRALREPVMLLAISVLPLVVKLRRKPWGLLILFAGTSIALALPSSMHAGANVNYFFEALFVLVPAATFGVLRIYRQRGIGVVTDRLCALLIITLLVLPNVRPLYWEAMRMRPGEIQAANRRSTALHGVLKDAKVFSVVPWAAILSNQPPVTEPFLLLFLSRAQRFDPRPLAERIRNVEFEAAITSAHPAEYRGVELSGPLEFRRAVSASYAPFCTYGDLVVQLPRRGSSPTSLGERLLKIGCNAMPSQ
jgi:hypothetical protein